MLLAVAVLLILTAAALVLFNFHNVVRAKIKVESIQQASALAGAQWQVIGLNMIGQVNLLKACTLMTAKDEAIPSTEPPPEAKSERAKKRHRLQSRLRTLTETQARISFIIPVMGYMAVQQTAKQNGMAANNTILKYYYEQMLPGNDYRDKSIGGYFWYEPYYQLIGLAAEQQAAVRCNARISELPEVWSNPEGSRKIAGGGSTAFRLLLSEYELYEAIESGNFCYWQLRKMAKDGVYLNDPWWRITYIPGNFIEESEIMPLGVTYGSSSCVQDLLDAGRFAGQTPEGAWNTEEEFQPDVWCKFDSKWYGSNFNQEAYSSHWVNWCRDRWLRSDLKKGFMYEGAVTAVDCSVETQQFMPFRMRSRTTRPLKIEREPNGRELMSPVSGPVSTEVGRTSIASAANRGVVAKVLGGFNDLRETDDAPTAAGVILPVFSRGLLIPSTMPYSVAMLTRGDDSLKRLLQWMAEGHDPGQEALPDGTSYYLQQLRKLTDPDYMRSIWNPDFPGIDHIDPERIFEGKYTFQYDSAGAGWLQQAYVGTASICPVRVERTGKINQDGSYETRTVPAVEDGTVTELPQMYVDENGKRQRYYDDYAGVTRIYFGSEKTGYRYLLKRNGKIYTKEDVACDGRLYYGGSPGGMTHGTQSGPPRL